MMFTEKEAKRLSLPRLKTFGEAARFTQVCTTLHNIVALELKLSNMNDYVTSNLTITPSLSAG
jgi:hypothetical protein